MKKDELNRKLDLILENQEKILKNEEKILKEEKEIEKFEIKEIENEKKLEKTEEEALKELKKLELELRGNISTSLKKITKKDVFKGFIGAFLGIMGHFAFTKASDIALELTVMRAGLLYIFALLIIMVILYYTGFRKVEKVLLFQFFPLRALTLFTVSIITVIVINFLFGKIDFDSTFIEIYKLVGASIILASMGAATADLIGRNE